MAHSHYSQIHLFGVVIFIMVPSMSQIDLLKNYLHSIGLDTKNLSRNNNIHKKNVNLNAIP